MTTTMKVATINRTYTNWGAHCEQALAFTLTGEIRKHDHVPFDKDSDIPEYNMSVKSSGFTLASAKVNHGETFEEKVTDFFARVHSTIFAYVANDFTAYLMDKTTFEKFIRTFGRLDRESKKNGGGFKVKCLKESQKMIEWLKEA